MGGGGADVTGRTLPSYSVIGIRQHPTPFSGKDELLTVMETQIMEVISMQGQCETESCFRLWVLSTMVFRSASKASVHQPKRAAFILPWKREKFNESAGIQIQ